MNFEKELEEALKRAIEKAAEKNLKIVTGIAINIDEEKRLFTLQREGEEDIEEIRINAVAIEENECTMIPKEGSAVVVVFVDGIKVGVMVNCSEVEKVNLVIGKTKLIITADGVNVETEKMKMEIGNQEILFNGGENKGLVKIEKLVDKINAIEKDVNTLKQSFTSWVPAPQDGGAALKGAVASWAGQQLQTTTKSDLENDKIKH